MDLPENRGCKLFQDSVHGAMKFDQLLVEFIDTPQFQRLRNIKQLSTTYLVYPAAAHNRFEHSLGVCWLAGQLMEHLNKNTSPKIWKEIFPDEEESKAVKLAIQIAGLLHDLGHGPFSHTWEVFVQACGENWDHEKTSCDLIDHMLWKDGKREEPLTQLGLSFKLAFKEKMPERVLFIKNVIMGRVPDDKKKEAFLYQVVANKFNDVDVDKWDYFLRDAQNLKMSVSFDYQRLMNLCRVDIIGDTSHIAFRDCERFSIQAMFRARADLHIRAYQHRVAKCIEAMLIDALKEANKNGYKVNRIPLAKVHDNPVQFSKLTDSIQETLYYSDDDDLRSTRAILHRITTRKLYPTVAEWPLIVKQTEDEKKNNKAPKGVSRKDLNELERMLEHKFAFNQVCVNQGKFFDPTREVKFYPKHGASIVEGNVPDIKMNLPFYKLFVFNRVQEEEEKNIERVKKTVGEFLAELNISLAPSTSEPPSPA